MRDCSAICLPTSTSCTSGLLGRFQAPGRFQISDPLWSPRTCYCSSSHSRSVGRSFLIGWSLVLGWVVLDLSRSERSRLCCDCSIVVLGFRLSAFGSSKVQAVQDGIHCPDESRTYIWSFIKTHLRTLDRWII